MNRSSLSPATARAGRVRLGSIAALIGLAWIATACADKGITRAKVAFSPKMNLQIVTTAAQQVGFGPKYLLVVAASASDQDTTLIAYKYAPITGGAQSITLPIDLSSCLAVNASKGKDGCSLLVGASLLADTTSLADTAADSGPFKRAFDFAIVGPFDVGPGRAPTIPAIDLSQTRFGVIYWETDEALRLGGNATPPFIQSGVLGFPGPIAGVANGSGAPTLFTLTTGIPASSFTNNNSTTPQVFQPYPQLAINQNGVWSRVTALTAPPQNATNNNPGFTDVTAIATNEVYMSAPSGLYRYDGSAITRVGGVTDSLTSVASVVLASGAKLVIAGGPGGIVWSGNGQTFQRTIIQGNSRIDGICITGPNEAFASSSTNGALYRFDGTAWTPVPALPTIPKLDLTCPGAGQAYVIAYQTSVLRWNGSGWSTLPLTGIGAGRLIRFAAASPNEMYAYADSALIDRAFYRFDGTAWRETGRLRFMQQAGRPWAVPGGGAAYVASQFGRVERMTSSGPSVVSYQPSLRDVAVNSATSAFAVGWNLFLARWDGATWNIDRPPVTNSIRILQSVWSDGPRNAWTVGNASTILRWDGSGWSVVSDATRAAGTPDNYNGVWGSGSDVWAVGDNSILHCKSPTSCSNEASGGNAVLYSVWGSSPTNVFAVGEAGRIVRYNGTSWSSMTSPTNRALARVQGSGPSDVWAVGDSVLIHFDGTQWSSVPMTGDLQYFRSHIPTPQERSQNGFFTGIFSLGLWVRSAKEVYLGGAFGGIARFDGKNWNELTNSALNSRRRIMGISGAAGGCTLAVTEAQTDAYSPTLLRGVGPTGCFGSPMSGPSSWP